MSPRIKPVDPATSTGKAQELFSAVQKKLGMVPNMMRTMAQSPAVLDAYLTFNEKLAHGMLPAKTREQIALAIAATNQCDYCASAHTVLGKMAGLTESQTTSALHGNGLDPKSSAAIRLAQQIIQTHGEVADADLLAARAAGLTDPEITEVIAHVALNIFTNYFNRLADTQIDFPVVKTAQLAMA